MISRTKYQIDAATIEKLFQSAGIEGAAEIAPLGAGEFNAVFSAKAGGREYALKIAPRKGAPILTYEKDMMRAEVFWYGQMRAHTPIAVPEVYHADFGGSLIPADWFVMEKLPGSQLDKMELTEEERRDSATELARMAACMHKVKNDRFGYIQNGLYDDWYQAIRAMVENAMQDAAKKGRASPRGKKLLTLIERYREVLKKAECCMVNFDLWAPNIICRRENGTVRYALIDPERTFWGDPIADFVCLEMMLPLAEKKASLEAYNAVADDPIRATEEECLRYAVMQGYLAFIMETEKYYRYTPFHYGWWRNVAASNMLYKAAFVVLD
jgi:aminoglycoside phosphotransferase (APT) family kinase protein